MLGHPPHSQQRRAHPYGEGGGSIVPISEKLGCIVCPYILSLRDGGFVSSSFLNFHPRFSQPISERLPASVRTPSFASPPPILMCRCSSYVCKPRQVPLYPLAPGDSFLQDERSCGPGVKVGKSDRSKNSTL